MKQVEQANRAVSADAEPSVVIPGRATDLGFTRDRRQAPKSAKADLSGASPESITPGRDYGFRAPSLTLGPRNDNGESGAMRPKTALVTQLAAAVLALALSAAPLPARADYPDKVVKIVVPVAAGGGVDVMARLLAQHLGERLHQQFVVENRPGAAGVIGSKSVIGVAGRRHDAALHAVEPVARRRRAQDTALRPRQGLHADRQRCDQSLCAGGASVGAGANRSRSSSPTPRPIPAS